MISNYFKIAWRSLWNKKAFSAINIFGLAIGLATCILILLFVQSELSYDKFNLNADRIYRVTLNGKIGGREINIAGAPAPVGPAISSDYPGIESYTRLTREGSFLVKYGNEKFKEERVVFADSNFFSVFSIPLMKGDTKSALKEPNTMVITEAVADKYFGKIDPIGKSLTLGTRGLFRITGVCRNVPETSHFHFDFFGSLASVQLGEKWLSSGAHTYLLLRKNYPVEKLAAQGPQIVKKYIAPEIQEFLGMSYEEYLRKGDRFGFTFQPLTDIHLNSDLENELEPNGDIKYVYIFSAIAAFILLLACINFMNLSTAGSANRAKEVGIRKVLGSIQQQLIFQFLTESILLTFLALLVAFVIVISVLPSFNQLAGKQFDIQTILNVRMIAYALAGCLFVGLLAGSYPAFFLSAFRPISVLKGKLQMGVRSGWLRNALVTVQFVVSIGMIIGTIVVYQQLRFIQNKKVGFDKDQVLILQDTYVLGDKSKVFKEELKKLSQIQDVTLAGYLPAGDSNNGTDGFLPESAAGNVSPFRLRTYQIDEDYLSTLGIGLAGGRNFSRSFSSDSAAVLVNEAAVKQFGWTKPIGQRISTVGNGSENSKRVYTVVGVTKNFHFESMHQSIAPLIMMYGGDRYQMALRIRTDNMPGLLKTLEQNWKAQTDSPFSYTFLNERFNKMYQSEQRIGALFGIFAGLAVVIACLGLFGLAAFTTLQRTKEIGVRKVLGASVVSIVTLLSKDFLNLIIVAIFIATPLAWYGMNQWLKDFAYKTDIEWWVFALAGLLTVCTALLTISFQSIKAALMDPVKSLKSE
ncbi:ABC transporter permease [Dyadobacter frigoris]|uniref:FtsX-like permease family protein n=1 Tax=Dyadobacter frigoris TaxID=2576211 RepID=A0A4U6CZS1_9BACT|nr:ABC transporter permease [Dyadobacter frigoris]TKT86964.1 FtsX-like permease family protein [Dyadobacter frigoris]GLU56528.1 ABC transporter permease [Dyadobacter frigoris]